MDNICEDELINEVYSKLKIINVDGVMDVNYLKSYIDNSNKTLFPTLLYTENRMTRQDIYLKEELLLQWKTLQV